MLRFLTLTALATGLGLLMLPARADRIVLRNGNVISGKVLDRTADEVRIQATNGIILSVAPLDVDRIEPDATLPATASPSPAKSPPPVSAPTPRPTPVPAPTPATHSDTCPRSCPLCDKLFNDCLDRYCAKIDALPANKAPIPARVGGDTPDGRGLADPTFRLAATSGPAGGARIIRSPVGGSAKPDAEEPVPGLANWPPTQVMTASVLGCVLVGEGNTLDKGRHAATLRRLANYVTRALTQDAKAFAGADSWIFGCGTLFLAEVQRVSPSPALKGTLGELVTRIEEGRQGSRGWCHGLHKSMPGGEYGPFVAVSLWCTAALALSKEQGVAVDAKCLTEVLGGLRGTIAGQGGASYYTYKRSNWVDAPRTGGVIWVLGRWAGDVDKPLAQARGFLRRHVDSATGGHASKMMGFAWTAMAASTGPDDELRADFWKVHRVTIMGNFRRDGSFPVVRNWAEIGYSDGDDVKPVQNEMNSGRDEWYGDSWYTAWALLAWQAGRGRCSLLVPASP